jgi:hypothetical protein
MSEQAQTLAIPANPPLQRPLHRFNKDNASALAKKSTESRLLKQREQAQYIAKLEAEAELARQLILAHAIATKPAPAIEPEERYRLEQLNRVREAIEQLWKDFALAEGGKEQQAIATAIAKLVDIEFSLAKRPKPAAYRTQPEKATKRSSQVEPED